MVALLERDDARKAHPTFEHILPLCMSFCFFLPLAFGEIRHIILAKGGIISNELPNFPFCYYKCSRVVKK